MRLVETAALPAPLTLHDLIDAMLVLEGVAENALTNEANDLEQEMVLDPEILAVADGGRRITGLRLDRDEAEPTRFHLVLILEDA